MIVQSTYDYVPIACTVLIKGVAVGLWSSKEHLPLDLLGLNFHLRSDGNLYTNALALLKSLKDAKLFGRSRLLSLQRICHIHSYWETHHWQTSLIIFQTYRTSLQQQYIVAERKQFLNTPKKIKINKLKVTVFLNEWAILSLKVFSSFLVHGGRSRLHLIDLASCERFSATKKETSCSSMSLNGLGNVIIALINGAKHVPHK